MIIRSCSLEAPSASAGEQAVSDPYAANMKALLAGAGFKVSEQLIRAEEALSRAFSFELLAALGPTTLNGLIDWMLGIGAHVATSTKCVDET